MPVAEWSIPLWRKGHPAFEMLRCIDYMGVLHDEGAYHRFAKVHMIVSHLSGNEVVYEVGPLQKGPKRIMLPEQKNALLMKDVMHKFSKRSQQYWTIFLGTNLQRRRVHFCTSLSGLVDLARIPIVCISLRYAFMEIYDSQLLNYKPCLTEHPQMKELITYVLYCNEMQKV